MSTDDNYKAGSVDNLFNMFKAQKYAEAKASINKLFKERFLELLPEKQQHQPDDSIEHFYVEGRIDGYNQAIDDTIKAFEDRYSK